MLFLASFTDSVAGSIFLVWLGGGGEGVNLSPFGAWYSVGRFEPFLVGGGGGGSELLMREWGSPKKNLWILDVQKLAPL